MEAVLKIICVALGAYGFFRAGNFFGEGMIVAMGKSDSKQSAFYWCSLGLLVWIVSLIVFLYGVSK